MEKRMPVLIAIQAIASRIPFAEPVAIATGSEKHRDGPASSHP
jgi:hypothetical protein